MRIYRTGPWKLSSKFSLRIFFKIVVLSKLSLDSINTVNLSANNTQAVTNTENKAGAEVWLKGRAPGPWVPAQLNHRVLLLSHFPFATLTVPGKLISQDHTLACLKVNIKQILKAKGLKTLADLEIQLAGMCKASTWNTAIRLPWLRTNYMWCAWL